MHIQELPTGSELIRFFNNGCYENRDKFDAVLTLVYSGDEVSINGLNGEFNFKFAKQLINYLLTKNIKMIHREVKGRLISTDVKNWTERNQRIKKLKLEKF